MSILSRAFAPHTVYELWGKDAATGDDLCLYVGLTLNLKSRLRQHRYKPWWPQVVDVRTTEYRDWTSGSVGEARTIAIHRPVNNVRMNPNVSAGAARRARIHGWQVATSP